jgi:hypothetical protein
MLEAGNSSLIDLHLSLCRSALVLPMNTIDLFEINLGLKPSHIPIQPRLDIGRASP